MEQLAHLGLSSICNVLAAIKLARREQLGANDSIVTVATDGADLYSSEIDKAVRKHFAGSFGESEARQVFEQHLASVDTDHLLELSACDRDRIFNLGYFTWVEQQGISVEQFEARRSQDYWQGMRQALPAWDERISRFNRDTGVAGSS